MGKNTEKWKSIKLSNMREKGWCPTGPLTNSAPLKWAWGGENKNGGWAWGGIESMRWYLNIEKWINCRIRKCEDSKLMKTIFDYFRKWARDQIASIEKNFRWNFFCLNMLELNSLRCTENSKEWKKIFFATNTFFWKICQNFYKCKNWP